MPFLTFQVLQPLSVQTHAQNKWVSPTQTLYSSCPKRQACIKMVDTQPKGNSNKRQPTFHDAQAQIPSHSFNWVEHWYPIAWQADFDESKPFPFIVWKTSLVLFKDKTSGHYVVMEDICPHRGASLSEGRLVQHQNNQGSIETAIQCPYHGWSFNGEGKCVCIPQLPNQSDIPKTANIKRTYPTIIRAGLIFFWFGDSNSPNFTEQPFGLPSEDISQFVDCTILQDINRIVPLNIIPVMENAMDPEHIHWTHHGAMIGMMRDHSTPFGGITLKNKNEITGEILCDIQLGSLANRSTKHILHFKPPGTIYYEAIIPDLGEYTSSYWAIPIGDEKTRVISFNRLGLYKQNLLASFLAKRPRWYHHTVANDILDNDITVVRSQGRNLQNLADGNENSGWKKHYELVSGKYDTAVLTYRKWLEKNIETIPIKTKYQAFQVETLNRSQVIDRYFSHTEKCSACRTAMNRMIMLRKLVLGIAVACAIHALVILSIAMSGSIRWVSTAEMIDMSGGSYLSNGSLLRSVCGSSAFPAVVIAVLLVWFASFLKEWISRFVYTERSSELFHSMKQNPFMP